MKKLRTLVLFLCLVSAGQAQQFKLIAGPTISHYSAEWPYYGNVFDASAHLNPFENRKIGFMVGGGVEVALNKIVSFELDGFYFQKGSTFEGTAWYFNNYRDVYALSGFNIPLLFKFKFLPRPFPYLLSGVEFSYIAAHARVRSYRLEGGSGWIEMPQEDLVDDTRRIDFGPVVGLGFEARLHKFSLFLEARYSIGLIDMPVQRDRFGRDPRTSSLVILTGLKFD
jgi:hypothetical protein